jgi:aconitase A
LPYSLRILLENLLRTEDGRNVTKEEVRALGLGTASPSRTKKSRSPRAACYCRISRESPRSSIWPRCAMP